MMDRLEFLQYLNRSPYKEALASLAGAEGANVFQVMNSMVDRRVGTSVEELRIALFELECDGLLLQVNECYHFKDSWFKELVRFLDEFEETGKEMDICEALLEREKRRA